MPQNTEVGIDAYSEDMEIKRRYHRIAIREKLQEVFDLMQREYFLYYGAVVAIAQMNDMAQQLLDIHQIMERYKDAEQSAT